MSSNFQHKIPFSIPFSRKKLFSKDSSFEKSIGNEAYDATTASSETVSDVSILILAAGNSSRLGQPKQLVEFAGKPLICHIIEQALFVKMRSVFVVLISFTVVLFELPQEVSNSSRDNAARKCFISSYKIWSDLIS